MDSTYTGIETIKKEYAKSLVEDGELQKGNRLEQKEFTEPIFDGYQVHPEEEPSVVSIQESITDITMDLSAITYELGAAADNYSSLMSEVQNQLNQIQEKLNIENERISDMNIICGNYDEFVTVKTIKTDELKGTFGRVGNGAITAKIISEEENPLVIEDVAGNGYYGNTYVLNDNDEFINEKYPTYDYNNMTDGDSNTVFEYSRLTSSYEELYPDDTNFDTIDSECAITVSGSRKFNSLKIISSQQEITLLDILTSNDNGATFKSCFDKIDPIQINSLTEKYENPNYIYGTGMIYFPKTKYLKIVLRSNGISEDKIGFMAIDSSDAKNPKEELVKLKNTKRRYVSISEMSSSIFNYEYESVIQTGELLDGTEIKSIAIFANEYIPDEYVNPQEAIEYVLTINGKDYDVVPINSWSNGTKVIRCTATSVADSYATKIQEPIKSARLTIKINSIDGETTPAISNLKICYGEAV